MLFRCGLMVLLVSAASSFGQPEPSVVRDGAADVRVVPDSPRATSTYGPRAFFSTPTTAQAMLARLLPVAPPGVTITGVTYVGYSGAAALFKDLTGPQVLPRSTMPDGVFMSSGTIPNLSNQVSGFSLRNGTAGDSQLAALLGVSTANASALTISFTTDSAVAGVSLQFMFGSDEFPEFLGSSYNDGFGVFLDGVNIAFDPSNKPITINNNFFRLNNTATTIANTTKVTYPIEYDGLTPVLTTSAVLSPGTHTLKLVVADGGDDAVDSGVFMSALSFGVVCPGTGVAPVLDPIPTEVTAEIGQTATVNLRATDANAGSTVTLLTSPSFLPDGMTLQATPGNPATGRIEFVPLVSQFGQTIPIDVFARNDQNVCTKATTKFKVTALIDPRVLAADMAITPASPVDGETATLSAVVRNPSVIAANVRTRFYLGALPDAGGQQIGADIPITVPAGGTASASRQWPTQGLAGDQQIFCVIDQVSPLSGDDTSNNVAVRTFAVQPAPDLTPLSATVPSQGLTEQPFEVRWTTSNIGAAPAGSGFQDQVFLSNDAAVGGDTLLGTFTRETPLGVGASFERIQNFNYPLVPGQYWIIVKTNANGAVNEGGRAANNVRVTGPIDVKLFPKPDLRVSAVVAPSSGIISGSTTQVIFTVENVGNAATSVARWRDEVVLTTDPNAAQSPDSGLCAAPVKAYVDNPRYLEPGQSYTQTAQLTLPSDVQGTYYVYVHV